MADLGKCRSCGAAIIWSTTTANKARIPLDAEPVEGGNIILHATGDCTVLKKADSLDSRLVIQLGGSIDRLRKSHFATCPNAAQHRKPR